MGSLPATRRILKLVPVRRQTLFFSATMPDDIRQLADSILRDPVTVQIGVIAPPKSISHALYPVSRGNKYDILVATAVASRGIDVAGISHVINYDVPDTADAYTHRVGRTGRVDQTGEALTLAGPEGAGMGRPIERGLGEP